MPVTQLVSATFFGIEAIKIDIEVDLSQSDKFSFVIVGLPDLAVKESKGPRAHSNQEFRFSSQPFTLRSKLSTGRS